MLKGVSAHVGVSVKSSPTCWVVVTPVPGRVWARRRPRAGPAGVHPRVREAGGGRVLPRRRLRGQLLKKIKQGT